MGLFVWGPEYVWSSKTYQPVRDLITRAQEYFDLDLDRGAFLVNLLHEIVGPVINRAMLGIRSEEALLYSVHAPFPRATVHMINCIQLRLLLEPNACNLYICGEKSVRPCYATSFESRRPQCQ